MACVFRVLIFLTLLTCSTSSAKVFLSIDCGASDASTDENGIKWVPDNDYIDSGDSNSVSSLYSLNSQILDTLRVFTTGTKNCYSIKVGKGEKVLVRASFHYGNYDLQYLGPSFDLVLNGELWETISIDFNYITVSYSYIEAIIVVERGDISVCLVQTTAGQNPFISALEVRSLDANMYSHVDSNRALYLVSRYSGSNTAIRYPEDIYDRIWSHTFTTTGTTISNPDLNIVTKVQDRPPVSVLQNAVTASSFSPLEFQVPLSAVAVPVYINMYFAELEELGSNDKRSFHVFLGDKRLTLTPITPPYGSVLEMTFTNVSASLSTVFHFKETTNSTLLPIINVFELFVYGNNNMYDYSDNSNNNNNDDDSDTGNNHKSTKARKKKKKNNLPAVLGTTIPASFVICVIVGVLLIIQLNKKRAMALVAQSGEGVKPNGTPNIT